MKKIAVSGGSGGAGKFVVSELLNAGYEVLNIDRVEPAEKLCEFKQVDITDYAAVEDALKGSDAVIHFASHPEPDWDFHTGAERFKNNTLCTYNIFNAAAALKMKKVVWASSETILGFPFDSVKPDSVPVTEDHLKPQNSYALSKTACTELAKHMSNLYGVPILGLVLTNILYTTEDHPANFQAIPSYWGDPFSRKFNLWGYVDARDAATAARLALEVEIDHADNFIIAAEDTIMDLTNKELMDAVFPGVEIKPGTGDHESLLSIEKAKTKLGYQPKYSWRNVPETQGAK